MKWIGLTGCMGCGKSTAASYYKSLGYDVYSADELIKELYADESVLTEIKKVFNLNRNIEKEEVISCLSETVFNDKIKLAKLEGVLHPKLRNKVEVIKKELEENSVELAFYDVPLLFEKNMESFFDFIICIGLDEETQKKRIKERNQNWSEENINARIQNQLSIDLKREKSSFYIENNKDLAFLYNEAQEVLAKIKKTAR